jgi:GTP-binding protein YchF
LQIGLVGLPGAGKTTLFNALVKANAEVGGYTGMKGPNRGTIKVPDRRVMLLSERFQPKKTTYATIDYLDIAGITAGAGKQEEQQGDSGLSALRQMDVLVHVLRDFPDVAGTPPSPKEDYEHVELELALADLEIIERRLSRLAKETRSKKTPDLLREQDMLEQCKTVIETGGAIRDLPLEPDGEKALRGYRFLSQKPGLLVLNIPETALGQEKTRLETLGDLPARLDAIALCAKVEMEIARLDETDAEVFLKDLGIEEPALTRMIITTYRLLNLISFFTVGEDEVRAWTITRGTAAPEAAGEIHSDLERGFIRAETVGWQELLDCGGSWAEVKEKGRLRVEGKQYIVQDGDVMNIRFNV